MKRTQSNNKSSKFGAAVAIHDEFGSERECEKLLPGDGDGDQQ
jgi:hypothetical protein